MQEYNDGIILFSAISIYVSPLTSVLRSNECQQALLTFHLQISVLSNTQCVEYGKVKIILIAKSPIKGYKVVDQSEQGKDPNNNDHRHLFRVLSLFAHYIVIPFQSIHAFLGQKSNFMQM
ncbi:hypothetical protein T03_14061 [Trichinella britovi]|uniref:Uncharacterized protein n=1 Tax=Trichinella britovi TaxID=45882 RepID=A0A0V1D2N4_TRIBR|nr:hypothetical protein T03_14061 [Trichinella britovi]